MITLVTYRFRGQTLTHTLPEDEGIARRQMSNIWEAADEGSVTLVTR